MIAIDTTIYFYLKSFGDYRRDFILRSKVLAVPCYAADRTHVEGLCPILPSRNEHAEELVYAGLRCRSLSAVTMPEDLTRTYTPKK